MAKLTQVKTIVQSSGLISQIQSVDMSVQPTDTNSFDQEQSDVHSKTDGEEGDGRECNANRCYRRSVGFGVRVRGIVGPPHDVIGMHRIR